MYYILNEHIGLRSWWRVPTAYYIKGQRSAKKLTKEEYDLLCKCDGNTFIEDGPLLQSLINKNFISPCEKGEKTLTSWQKKECDNRYFPAMNWMITGKCNYNCLHCFNAADNAPLMSEFSMEEAIQLLDEAEKCGINAITITGGEPMCHKHFLDILEAIYHRGMYVDELNTNGFYITQDILDKMKEIGCNPLVKISLDGIGHHDWLRNRKGAEASALNAMKMCIENGFVVKVQTNVHRRNVESMLPTARVLDEMGVSEMRIICTTEIPRWKANSNGATLDYREYFDYMLDFLESYSKENHNMGIDIWQMLNLYPKQKSYRLRAIECGIGEYRDTIPVCRGNRGMVAITASGRVFPCIQISGYYEARKEHFGNVKETGLQSLLQCGKYLAEVCTTVGELANKNETCRTCPYFKYCLGGCRALALTTQDDKFGYDPSKCIFFREGYIEKLAIRLPGWTNLTPIE